MAENHIDLKKLIKSHIRELQEQCELLISFEEFNMHFKNFIKKLRNILSRNEVNVSEGVETILIHLQESSEHSINQSDQQPAASQSGPVLLTDL